jgi:membrane peptidoglycan carboxypeptidase
MRRASRLDPAAPVIGRIDLSEAYRAVRTRARALRRRRIVTTAVAALVLSGVLTAAGVYYVGSVPLPADLSLPATTTVYYSDGVTVMARLGTRNRIPVDPAALPRYVSEAVVAAADPGFWDDSAARITRQYARLAAGIEGSGATARAHSVIMAWKLEDQYPKAVILGYYLNTVYFGRGAYGIGAAAVAYFGRPASTLGLADAILLAGMITAPGRGRYDPTVDPVAATGRFAEVAVAMVRGGTLDERTARQLRLPRVHPYDPRVFESGLDRPTGLVVAQVLAELRAAPAFRDWAPERLTNGGLSIVTTVDAGAQALLERVAGGGEGSPMAGQPGNLQAAAALVEPGTGRVLAYYGGPEGTGADFAGWYREADGTPVGYGAHPPGHTVDLYVLAAALRAGVGVRSRWQAPRSRAFPGSGRPAGDPVRDVGPAACRPECTLAEATTAALTVPYFALTERLGADAVVRMARAAGVGSLWLPETGAEPRRRVDLADPGAEELFGVDVALGRYPVTVLDQAAAAATFAARGRPAPVHFVRRVTGRGVPAHVEPRADPSVAPVLAAPAVDDLTWVLRQAPAAALPSGRPSAAVTGHAPLRTSLVETAHAWTVGWTPDLALAVWVGNEEIELPLRERTGGRVLGDGLPAEIFRATLDPAHQLFDRPRRDFPEPTFTGDDGAGDA